jgi:hypothetical protein
MAFLVNCFAHRRSVVAVLFLTALIGAAEAIWRPVAQVRTGGAPAEIQTIEPTAHRKEQGPADRGATFEWLEKQATRVTITFPGAVSISERASDGDLKTRLTDAAGNELATLAVDRVDAMNDVLEFHSSGVEDLRAQSATPGRPTLDWAGRQAYILWKDRVPDGARPLEWRNGLIRSRGAPDRDLDREIAEVRTEWRDGLSAVAVQRSGLRRNVITGAPTRGGSFVSRFRKDNADVGFTAWYAEEGVLAWSFRGLSEGHLDAGRLDRIGGWPFTPDLAWANVQSYAFHYFHSQIANEGFVAGQQRGWRDKVLGVVMPTLLAGEPGCDGLHWLDRTIFRPCCDNHDRCYQKYGCTSSSWWLWWRSWACDRCNGSVVFCFVTRARPFFQTP